MSDLCVLTRGSAKDLALLKESCDRVGVDLVAFDGPWKGFVTSKLREGVAVLSGRQERYAMWIDGYDSLLLKSEADILARINACGSPMVIAAERNCWPDASLAEKFPMVIGQPRYINAGGFIGLRGEVLTAMHTVIQYATDEDDQRAFTAAYLAGALPNLQIDHGRNFFCSEADGDTERADPCVRHWNGKITGRQEFWDAIAVKIGA